MDNGEAESGQATVVMTGRSTMELWFKHWNWPRFLRLRGTYRAWPIHYTTFEADGALLKLRRLDPPADKKNPGPWGERMVASFSKILEEESPDIAFFKFCFVDFRCDENEVEQRLADLQKTVRAVHEAARENGVRLIVGNALPTAKPKAHTILLQRQYNEWLESYAQTNGDVLVFDLYGRLADETGVLPRSKWRAADDIHINDDTYGELDEPFFSALSGWLSQPAGP